MRAPALAVIGLLGLGMAVLLPGCERAQGEDEALPPHSLGAALSAPMWLAPPVSGTLAVGGQVWVAFRRGASLPGEAVHDALARFDYVPFRLGGDQTHVEPAVRAGELGLALTVGDRRGSSLIGFTTEPRLIRIGSADKPQVVRLFEHGVLCLHLRRGTWELPEPSPVVANRFGFGLEFAPVFDPLTMQAGDELLLRLRFGEGVVGVEVVAEQIPAGERDAVEVFRGKTEAEGVVRVPIRRAGLWRLSAQHRVADELHRATLVFRTGER
ncbi:MAG: hypothetical protein CMJ85_11770 [Planctomycetes bacterium]|nr:hypothetical protein [Planctomycetota bacterium]MDP6423311.1 DUF4198 domain-containing protein [Planctomycetota bacterium]